MEQPGDSSDDQSPTQIDLAKALSDLLSLANQHPAILSVPPDVSASVSTISAYLHSLNSSMDVDLPSHKATAPGDPVEGPENMPLALQRRSSSAPVVPDPPMLSTAQLKLLDELETKSNIYLNRKTSLEKVYVYQSTGHILHYPQTSGTGSIGHLLVMGPSDWDKIIRNIAYSCGDPRGGPNKMASGTPLLLDDSGASVPCTVIHTTCQGMKICPQFNTTLFSQPHVSVTPSDLARQIEKLHNPSDNLPMQRLFQKTLEYFNAFRKFGCQAPPFEETNYTHNERISIAAYEAHRNLERRGHDPKPACNGRILYEYTAAGKPYVRCEHYNRLQNKDHLIDFGPGSDLYDSEYLEALFLDRTELIEMYERRASEILHVGPYMSCLTVRNKSSVKASCASSHRNSNGELVNMILEDMPCEVTFRLYQPSKEYRDKCPFSLLVSTGAHTHSIPIPSKTPPIIQSTVLDLIRSLYSEVPDLTPRRFLRHASVKAFLRKTFPEIQAPMLLDLHPSLGNRDHLRSMINLVQQDLFPCGTGWEGVMHFKDLQSSDDPYVRICEEISHLQQPCADDDSADDPGAQDEPLKIVICMTKSQSVRLSRAKYIQCDIGFKRVHGFKEFELGGLDDTTRTAITYCRIFLTRQTAYAHRTIFHKIDQIVLADTGQSLQWRHIHSPSGDPADAVGILHLAVDQHGGQAKGFGQYLYDLAHRIPDRPDFHTPSKSLHGLEVYDHLHRILRLCANHYLRNIQKCAVGEPVRQKMRNLMCIRHPHWERTIQEIGIEGGKAAQDWLRDKERSGFAFEGICWEKSCMPLIIWQTGDETSNIIESLHQDINHEGIGCTLLGGILKAQHFDALKDRTLENYAMNGVRSSYKLGTLADSSARSLKRKANVAHKILEREDTAIIQQNKRVKETYDALYRLENSYPPSSSKRIDTAHDKFQKAVEESKSNIGKGSGKIGVLLPMQEYEE